MGTFILYPIYWTKCIVLLCSSPHWTSSAFAWPHLTIVREAAPFYNRGEEEGWLLPATEILLHFHPHTFPPDFYP